MPGKLCKVEVDSRGASEVTWKKQGVGSDPPGGCGMTTLRVHAFNKDRCSDISDAPCKPVGISLTCWYLLGYSVLPVADISRRSLPNGSHHKVLTLTLLTTSPSVHNVSAPMVGASVMDLTIITPCKLLIIIRRSAHRKRWHTSYAPIHSIGTKKNRVKRFKMV